MLERHSQDNNLSKSLLLTINDKKKAEVLKIPGYILSTRESLNLYHNIKRALEDFDRRFDNTVVDTYAFDKVLHSDKLANVIYFYLSNHDLSSSEMKENITIYVLAEIELIYERTNHKIFRPEVYYEYIDELLKKI